ncbi:21344_t:CDS:2 [Entrophospora sp. SA101]|nr:21344_t:CDS:2 [Entrophospora sp. SA101]
MSQPIQPDPIQPPRPNELNDLFDTLLDENIHIDNYNDKPLVSDQISQEMDSDKNVPFEKWCAPADFSLDSDNSTLKKNAMNLKNELL